MLGIIAFSLVFILTFSIAARRFMAIRRNINLGKDEVIAGNEGKRWKNVLLVAFGQKKMFKNWIPAVLHLFIYVAFLFTQIELIEIFVDGFTGNHRFFAPYLGIIYTIAINTIEILSVLAFIGTIAFLSRRNILRIARFQKPEMIGWPSMDANIILGLELVLLIGIFTMNGTDVLLQEIDPDHYPDSGKLMISSIIGPAVFGWLNKDALVFLERAGWWLHILTVFGFLLYLPFSKHLHIVLAFPNTWFARLRKNGKMENMPDIMREVQSMMGIATPDTDAAPMDEIPEFGSNDVFNLSWKNILDAYSCTECGRCTAQCPANITGKKLSPRKIMMDVRDRAEEVGANLDTKDEKFIKADKRKEGAELTPQNYEDGKSLFDYITPEELHACTTCNACVEACPILIDPLEIILKMRRYEILTLSAGPSEWVPMFTSMENNGSVWQMPVDRDQWAKDAIS
jgi:heterodisulfide reductase subunit C